MLHATTRALIDKLHELTLAGELSWIDDGQDNQATHIAEGYRLTLRTDERALMLFDAGGRDLETVPRRELLAATRADGRTYADIVDEIVVAGLGRDRGKDFAIETLLGALGKGSVASAAAFVGTDDSPAEVAAGDEVVAVIETETSFVDAHGIETTVVESRFIEADGDETSIVETTFTTPEGDVTTVVETVSVATHTAEEIAEIEAATAALGNDDAEHTIEEVLVEGSEADATHTHTASTDEGLAAAFPEDDVRTAEAPQAEASGADGLTAWGMDDVTTYDAAASDAVAEDAPGEVIGEAEDAIAALDVPAEPETQAATDEAPDTTSFPTWTRTWLAGPTSHAPVDLHPAADTPVEAQPTEAEEAAPEAPEVHAEVEAAPEVEAASDPVVEAVEEAAPAAELTLEPAPLPQWDAPRWAAWGQPVAALSPEPATMDAPEAEAEVTAEPATAEEPAPAEAEVEHQPEPEADPATVEEAKPELAQALAAEAPATEAAPADEPTRKVVYRYNPWM
jgi:hypothetical protein